MADFNIAAAGDWGCNSNTDKTVNNIVGKNPELVLGLGDYSYQETATCWFNKIESIDSITKINIGNHDDNSSESYSSYINHFNLDNPYYSYNLNNVHILTMDSDRTSYFPGSAQYNFVINDLQSAAQNPNVDWIIVSIHQWIYRSSDSNSLNEDVAEIYHPLFDQYGVDLVLAGHDHKYHRTYPLNYNPSNPENPIITSSNTKDYTNPHGAIFAVVGTGGINLAPVDGSSPFVVKAQDDYFGQLDIKITNNGAKLEARFYPNGGGSTKDSFSITKPTGSSGSYNYAPSFAATGSNYFDVTSATSLKLSQFSVAAWFKTSTNFASEGFIVNKGGIGSDSAGQNMNYQISMTSAEQIKVGFETSTGADHFVTSANTYNDGQWHYAVVTYSGSTVRLYIDGVQVGSKSTLSASPETSNTKPVRIGANSRVTPPTNFYTGEVDEVRVWNDDLTAQQVADAFAGTNFNTADQVLYLDFTHVQSGL